MNLLDLFVKIGVDDQASGQINGIANNMVGNLGSAAMKVGKLIAAGFAVKKVVDFGKAAFDSYQQYEQLWGGVQKLYGNAGKSIEDYAKSVGKSVDEVSADYQRNERAQQLMLDNANEAWKSAGMDANTYMEKATSFSASLINSLGGDTEKAAQLTDTAMRAMSDNINTFGTDAQSVQNAFQGFAKQNYTMLDNLKLGYGGTKSEMERLVKDANEYAKSIGQAGDLSVDSFADVVSAIELVQEKQGIAGTTQREALETIEGSMNATKAAWSNFVGEFGKGGDNIEQRWDDLVTSATAAAGNITQEVGVIASAMVGTLQTAVSDAIDDLITNGPDKLDGLLTTIEEKLGSIASDIEQNGFNLGLADALLGDGEDDGIASKLGTFFGEIKAKFEEHWPEIKELGTSILGHVAQGISDDAQRIGPWIAEQLQAMLGSAFGYLEQNWGSLVSGQFEAQLNIADWFWNMAPNVVDAVAGLLQQVQSFIGEHGPEFAKQVPEIMSNIAGSIGEHLPSILSGVGQTIGRIVGYVAENRWQMINAAIEFVGGLLDGSSQEGQKLAQWFSDFFPDGALSLLGDIGSLLITSGQAFIDGFISGVQEAAPNITGAIQEAFGPVLDFFADVGTFLLDPIAFVADHLLGLSDTAAETAGGIESSFAGVSGAASKELGATKTDIKQLNNTPLKDKKVKYEADGNVTDGKAKDSVDKTDTSINKLSSKTVSVKADGNVINGSAKQTVDNLIWSMSSLRDKTVTLTTRNRTENIRVDRAWGGIKRFHAKGGFNIASRYGEGLPLDYVGEKGPEAIVPLKSPYGTDFARMMGKEAAKYVSGRGDVNIYLDYNAGEDATTIVHDIAGELRTLGLVS